MQVAHREDEYESFLTSIQGRLNLAIERHGKYFFSTNVKGLFDTFLLGLPLAVRQHYTCNACRCFVNKWGGIVSITEQGMSIPVFWDFDVPNLYHDAVMAARSEVSRSKVTGVFVSADKVWGQPVTGVWHHMAITPPNIVVLKSLAQTAGQVMAEKHEDFKMLLNGLREYPIEVVEQALAVLRADSLYRSEKVLGVAEWLARLHKQRSSTKNAVARTNMVWRAVAAAPSGFCHIRSTMIGTLLDDIIAGLSFDSVSRRFAEKMHPLHYQRPQALPSQGNILQAEKVLEKFGAAAALERRFATLEEIPTLWKPAHPAKHEAAMPGVFGHLKSKESISPIKPMEIPPITITWEKFYHTVVPTAEAIMFFVGNEKNNYSAILTATNPAAPPILQWDFEEKRNQFSWYVYNGGSHPSQWELTAGEYHPVTGICFQPSMWGGMEEFARHHGESVFFLLEGAKDVNIDSLAIFPETLKNDFHSIRATIEAYSKSRTPTGVDEASACGIRLQKGIRWIATFKVISGGASLTYRLDRWD